MMESMTVHTYIVRKGESARSVADKFEVTVAALTRENATPFYEGQLVTVPVGVLRFDAGNAPKGPGSFFQVPETSIMSRRGVMNIIFL